MPDLERMAYGYGLFIADDVRFGRIVGHSGGYPGFGSNMRWHPATGLGVIALTNHRYGGASLLARDLLAELLRSEAAPARRTRPNAATEAAREAVEAPDRRLGRRARRRAVRDERRPRRADRRARARSCEKLRDRHGAADAGSGRSADRVRSRRTTSSGGSTARTGGRVKVEILLSPELPPRVQTFGVTSVPEPPPALRTAAERIVAELQPAADGRPVSIDWPAELSVGQDVDVGAIVRAMRATEARFAPISIGRPIDGDGERKATCRLESPRGRVDLALTHDPVADCLDAVSLTPVRMVPPELD